MQLRNPVLEIHHLDRGAGLAMRFLDAGELRRGGMDGGIGRGYRFQPPPHFHHVGRARTFHAGHDFRHGRAGQGIDGGTAPDMAGNGAALKAMEIAKRQAFEEMEISAGEEVERARIMTERGVKEARVVRDREIRKLVIDRDKTLELEELEKAISLAAKSKERSAAIAEAQAAVSRAEAAAKTYAVDAEGQRQANEAENLLTNEARASRTWMRLLDKIEGIVRESVRPMEKIDAIKILHVDGLGGGEGSRKNVTDEVIDSALRYGVQAPMIDSLMKEVGIQCGSVGRMTDVLRDAKDLDTIVRNRKKKGGKEESEDHGRSDRDDDR